MNELVITFSNLKKFHLRQILQSNLSFEPFEDFLQQSWTSLKYMLDIEGEYFKCYQMKSSAILTNKYNKAKKQQSPLFAFGRNFQF